MTALTDEQRMLMESAQRWCERANTAPQRRAVAEHPTGCPPERWRELGDMGWLGIALPEADGGLGAGLLAQCLLAETLGRGLLMEPYVASVALGSALMAEVADGELRADWLPALADGTRRVVWAAWEPGGDAEPSPPRTQATRQGDMWRLTGVKSWTPGAGGADALLVAAQMPQEPAAIGLFLVETAASGVTLDSQRLYDDSYAARVEFSNAPARLLRAAPSSEMLALLARVLDRGRVVHGAQTLGTAQTAFEITRDYLRTRRQFGHALSDNQVLQHRLVDLYVELQEAHALCLAAAQDPQPRLVAALGTRCAEVARHVWEEAVQLHGAIGMTEEYVLGAYVRRLALAADLYGTGPDCSERLAELSLGAAS